MNSRYLRSVLYLGPILFFLTPLFLIYPFPIQASTVEQLFGRAKAYFGEDLRRKSEVLESRRFPGAGAGIQARIVAPLDPNQSYRNTGQARSILPEGFEQEFLSNLKRKFSGLYSLPEERAALNSVSVVIEDLTIEEHIGRYAGGTLFINRTGLEQSLSQLRRQRVSENQIASIMAVHYIPVLAHELRHAVNDKKYNGIAATMEEEISGFYATVAAQAEAGSRYPDAFATQTVRSGFSHAILDLWRRAGPEGLRRYVMQNYENSRSLEDGAALARRGEFAAGAAKDADQIERGISGYKQLAQRCAEETGDPADCLRELKLPATTDGFLSGASRNQIPNERFARAVIADYRGQSSFWSDDEKITRARAGYRAETSRAWAAWKSQSQGKEQNQIFPERKSSRPSAQIRMGL